MAIIPVPMLYYNADDEFSLIHFPLKYLYLYNKIRSFN